jgi:hypothetical protein
MKIAIKHGMTKDEAMARVEAKMPDLINAILDAICEAHAEYMRLPAWRRWILRAWAIPRYGPGWAWDKYRWSRRMTRRMTWS